MVRHLLPQEKALNATFGDYTSSGFATLNHLPLKGKALNETVRHGYRPKSRLNQAFPKEGKVVVVPVRKDGSAAKPSRRSDEYAFQPHPPLTRSPFPDLGEGFKLNRSHGNQPRRRSNQAFSRGRRWQTRGFRQILSLSKRSV